MPEALAPELSLVPITVPSRSHERSFDDRACAPGWFDSSWELRRGLEVKEGWFGDDDLNGWIESFLFAQRACGATAARGMSTAMA
nr:hypothetical protein [Caldimonas sp.]